MGKLKNIYIILNFPTQEFLLCKIKEREFQKSFRHSVPNFKHIPAPFSPYLVQERLMHVFNFFDMLIESKKIPKKLYWVNVPVMTNEKCNEGYKGEVLDSMICAGYESGGKDGCDGDSGGPLVCPNEKNNPIITGVVSWGHKNKCAAAK